MSEIFLTANERWLAERISALEDFLAAKPQGLTAEQTAKVLGALTTQAERLAKIAEVIHGSSSSA